MRRLEVDVFPSIGRMPVANNTPQKLLEVIRRIEARGVIETSRRALENCSQVLRGLRKCLGRPSPDRHREHLQALLGVSKGVVGTVGGGKVRPTGKIGIAVMQSLSLQGEVNSLVDDYGKVTSTSATTSARVLSMRSSSGPGRGTCWP